MPLIFGRDAGSVVVPILIETDGTVHVLGSVTLGAELPAGTQEIGSIQAREYGRYAGAWQKNPLMFGYSGHLGQVVQNLALAAGQNFLDLATPPAGRLYVYTNFSIKYTGTVAGVSLGLQLIDAVTGTFIDYVTPPASGIWYITQGMWPVLNPHVIRLNIQGATLNDDGEIRASGYYMDLNL